MFTRWLTVSLVAVALGAAALEFSASQAAKAKAASGSAAMFTDAAGPGVPSGAETNSTEVSALPSFTW